MKTLVKETDLTDLAQAAVGHLSMLRQIGAGLYKSKPADVEARLTWLQTNYPLLRDGNELCSQVADEINRLFREHQPDRLNGQPADYPAPAEQEAAK